MLQRLTVGLAWLVTGILVVFPAAGTSASIAEFAFPGASLSWADHGFLGEADYDYSGDAVASAGDVDGDGRADILIGAPGGGDSGEGKTYLLLAATVESAPSPLDLAEADYIFVGEVAADDSGASVAGVGDVDGDGLDDILIGAAENDEGGSGAGKSYLFLAGNLPSSPATLELGADADYAFVGEELYDESGWSVAGAGDVDGDGLADVLIGAPRNGDGVFGTGKTYLFLAQNLPPSPATLTLGTDGDYEFVGETDGDFSARSVASAGDVDGDGLADILIGADGFLSETAVGKTYLILGQSLPPGPATLFLGTDEDYAFVGNVVFDGSGRSVAGAGDVDGDGLHDILIGAPYADDSGDLQVGKTALVLAASLPAGPAPVIFELGEDAAYVFIGERKWDNSGLAVASAGDVDGDGLDDVLLGVYHNDDATGNQGQTYLFLAQDLPPSPARLTLGTDETGSFLGETQHAYAGISVAGAGDVDGDGLDDILIGARRTSEGTTEGGKTYLIHGSAPAPTPPMLSVSGTCPGVVTFEMAGFSSGGTIALFGSTGEIGVFLDEGPCAGAATTFHGPILRATVLADGTGAASVTTTLPAGVCRRWTQALDVTTCARTVAQRIP